MKDNTQRGFSLIELLLVVVIVGVIAAIAVPAYQKSMIAAESGNTIATLRTVSSSQISFYTQHGRFGRLDEINDMMSHSLGTVAGGQLFRNKYVWEMTPLAPTDAELKDGFMINATRNVAGDPTIFQYELTHTGQIRQIFP
jgi:prepilin-type N-terminal cleavage/methylation domain-containing protein